MPAPRRQQEMYEAREPKRMRLEAREHEGYYPHERGRDTDMGRRSHDGPGAMGPMLRAEAGHGAAQDGRRMGLGRHAGTPGTAAHISVPRAMQLKLQPRGPGPGPGSAQSQAEAARSRLHATSAGPFGPMTRDRGMNR